MYKVVLTESIIKDLKKLDKHTVRVIKNWITKNLMCCEDPRAKGKALIGKNYFFTHQCPHTNIKIKFTS